MRLLDIFTSALSAGNEISEKRLTKMIVISVMLSLTIGDFFLYAHSLRVEILLPWLTLCGYDGYRMTQEKKMKGPPTEDKK